MTKKKELVENFQEIIDSGDMEAFKKVFDTCEISATKAPRTIGKGRTKHQWQTNCNAFSYKNLTPAHIQFLVDSGLEVNSNCGYGYPAITFQASNKENLRCLLDNGADIECVVSPKLGTPLAIACMCQDVDGVRNLIDAGASIRATGVEGKTLVDLALSYCGERFSQALSVAKMLLEHGAKTTDKTREYLFDLARSFAYERANMTKEEIDEINPLLDVVLSRLDISPIVVPQKNKHDGVSAITVNAKNLREQFDELWAKLVPESGKAQTVQGEMIRIAGKVSYEILNNGGLNWDGDYKKMVQALSGYVSSFNSSENAPVDEANSIIKKISASTDEKPLYRLTEIIVNLVIANPQPVQLGEVDYIR